MFTFVTLKIYFIISIIMLLGTIYLAPLGSGFNSLTRSLIWGSRLLYITTSHSDKKNWKPGHKSFDPSIALPICLFLLPVQMRFAVLFGFIHIDYALPFMPYFCLPCNVVCLHDIAVMVTPSYIYIVNGF